MVVMFKQAFKFYQYKVMNKKQATILHNIVRYPMTVISIPIQIIAIGLKYVSDLCNRLADYWGEFLIKRLDNE